MILFQEAYFESMIHEDDSLRPGMLVVAGGGYDHVSKVESYHVADFFFERGFQTFILKYSTAPIGSGPVGLKPLGEIIRAVRMIRSMSEEYKLTEGALAACGFSAGGHLIATLCGHSDFSFSDPGAFVPQTGDPVIGDLKNIVPQAGIFSTDDPYDDISALPDAVILGYPVITMMGPYIHESSVRQLLGNDPSQEELEFMSAQLHVTSRTPPTFIFSMTDDQSVPVQNSYMYAKACQESGVPCALHIFSHGSHGMALADGYDGRFTSKETAKWPDMAVSFINTYIN